MAFFPRLQVEEPFDAPFHRGRLQQLLLDSLPPGIVHLGAELIDFEQDPAGVAVRLADGRSVRGDLLVGADGIRSVVRQLLVGDGPPRYVGYGGWLGVVQHAARDFPPGSVFESWGRGRRVGLLHCGPGELYWFAVANRREPLEGVRPGGKVELLRQFDRWHAPVPEVLAATPEENMVQLSYFDRPPLARWSHGRVTLLGDAAHPMTPNLGQGACQAIEDAFALADAIAARGPVAERLQDYDRRRTQRAARLVRKSHRLGQIAQLEHPALCSVRNRLLKWTPRRWQLKDLADNLGQTLPRDLR